MSDLNAAIALTGSDKLIVKEFQLIQVALLGVDDYD